MKINEAKIKIRFNHLVITQIDESETEQTDPDAPDGYNEAELEDMMNEDNNDDQ